MKNINLFPLLSHVQPPPVLLCTGFINRFVVVFSFPFSHHVHHYKIITNQSTSTINPSNQPINQPLTKINGCSKTPALRLLPPRPCVPPNTTHPVPACLQIQTGSCRKTGRRFQRRVSVPETNKLSSCRAPIYQPPLAAFR